jgi:putative membrane protein
MNKTKMMIATMAMTSFGMFAHAQAPAAAPAASGSAMTAAPLTDGQIVHIMKTANEGEVDLAKVAKSNAENKDVKEFAKQMIDAHKESEKGAKDAAKRAKVDMTKNDTSKNLENMVETQRKELKKLKGKEFDRAYIGQQIVMHKQLLDDLNQKLIPSAQSPDVKSYLETTKSHVESHLSQAQKIQDTLAK